MKRYAILWVLLQAFTVQIAWGQLTSKPEDVKWTTVSATFFAPKMTLGQYARIVDDPGATQGKAVAAFAGSGRDSHLISGGWVPVKTDATYSVAFRLRMELANVTVADQAHVMYVGTEGRSAEAYMPFPLRLEVIHRLKRDDPATESVAQWYFVDAPSADAVKDYHDYVVKFERPVPGFVGFRVYWYGRAFASVWLDQIKLLEEPLPSEAEQLKDVAPDGPMRINHQRPLTLVLC